jgi:hypothetical protein
VITKKMLTDDLSFSRKAGKLHLKYKGKQLSVIAEKVLFQLLLDAAPSSFLKDLAQVAGVKADNADTHPKAIIKLATVYAFERLNRLGKSPISHSDVSVTAQVKQLLADKKTLSHFRDAVNIMKQNGIRNCEAFIAAQIKGLSFVNNGKGVFPTPAQLASANALNRVIDYSNKVKVNPDSKEDKPKQYWYFNHIDAELPLNKNDKYKEVIEKIKSKTATMDECVYAQKCFKARRNGQSYATIDNYIKSISN